MGHCSQHRSHRLLLVSPPRAQTALPTPPRGSAFNIHVDRWGLSEKSPQKKCPRLSQTPMLLLLLLWFHTPVQQRVKFTSVNVMQRSH